MKWYLKVLKQYADFTGRANRKEYWFFVLFNFIAYFVLYFISEYIAILYSLAVLLPGIAVGVRRLHDIGKSGWMMFIGLIPLIGAIWLIVLMVQAGDADANEYGPPPEDEPLPSGANAG